MKEFYMFLNSSASNENKTNKFFDFTVNIPYQIDLSKNKWEIGLTEISFLSMYKIFPDMYICCDIITPSFLCNKTEQILRYIPISNGIYQQSFDNILYFEVVEKSLDKIRIYINTPHNNLPSLDDSTLYCTVHLREKK